MVFFIAKLAYDRAKVAKLGFILLTVVSLIGVALNARGPDLHHLTEMAEQAVILPDGTALYVQKYEVTVAEWNACNTAGACALLHKSKANQNDMKTPATDLSYVDVNEYLTWINIKTESAFRLPTLRE